MPILLLVWLCFLETNRMGIFVPFVMLFAVSTVASDVCRESL